MCVCLNRMECVELYSTYISLVSGASYFIRVQRSYTGSSQVQKFLSKYEIVCWVNELQRVFILNGILPKCFPSNTFLLDKALNLENNFQVDFQCFFLADSALNSKKEFFIDFQLIFHYHDFISIFAREIRKFIVFLWFLCHKYRLPESPKTFHPNHGNIFMN